MAVKMLGIVLMTLTIIVDKTYQADHTSTVCQNEAFDASCGPDEVVMMTSATYGRSELSRCVERDYGYVGCSRDVLKQSDYMCSGQHKCTIPIPNSYYDQVSSCPGDLKSYLTAAHTCLKVVTAPEQSCRSDSFVRIDASQSGYLASAITEDTKKGSHSCPWLLVAQPGQRLNITLIDFTQPGTGCQAYASFKDRHSDGQPQTICGGEARVRQAHMSNTDALEIRFFGASKNSPKRFLLKYEAISCADPKLPPNAVVERQGDVITVQCAAARKTWRMRCEDNEWKTEGDEAVACPGGSLEERAVSTATAKNRIPFGLSIVIIVCIAVVLGILILLFGLVILKRRRRQHEVTRQNFYQCASKAGHDAPLPRMPPGGKEQDSMYQSSENEYEYIGELPSHYNAGVHGTQNLTNRQLELYQARRHEPAPGHCKQHPPVTSSSSSARKASKEPKGSVRYVDCCEPPAYFELDPDGANAHDGKANSGAGAMTRVNQSVHEFSPYGYDHLVDQSGNSNHKSV